jgi:hypothetical protein
MSARSPHLAVLAAFVAGCASAPPPAPPAPPPPPAEEPGPVAEPPHVEPPSDPNVVRCGIDDRPRAIQGRAPAEVASEPRAKIAVPSAPFPAPQQPGLVPPPRPRVVLKVDTVRAARGSTLPAKVASALGSSATDLDGCEPLATPEDESKVELAMSLSSGGAPLRVLPPSSSKPSPYVRCLMERACQLRGGEDAPPAEVVLPLTVTWNYPRMLGKALPPNQGVVPRVFFEARPELDASTHAFPRTLRQLTRQAARTCVGQLTDTTVRVTLTLSKAKTPRVLAAKVVELAPGFPQGTEDCLYERMKISTLAERPEGFTAEEVSLVVAW